MRKFLAASLLALMASTGPAFAQAKDQAKDAGDHAAQAGKEAGSAAKDAGKATVSATKKAAKKTKKAVTGDAHATCVDGTVQAGKTEAAAASGCTDHGGVAKK